MKNIAISILLLLSLNLFSQDTIARQKFSLGLGPSWGNLKWGGNVNLAYAASNKISLKLRAVLMPGKENVFKEQYDVGIQKESVVDLSVSVNYFLLGNTKPTCKGGVYIGLGLGYYQEAINTSFLFASGFYNSPSYQDKYRTKGLEGNACLGAMAKLGPGKIYLEAYFSMCFAGQTTEAFTFMNASSPSQVQVNRFKEDFDRQGIVGFNLGYAIPF